MLKCLSPILCMWSIQIPENSPFQLLGFVFLLFGVVPAGSAHRDKLLILILGKRKNEQTPSGVPQPRMDCTHMRLWTGFTRSRPNKSQKSLHLRLRLLSLLLLFTPPVPGHALRLVHRQCHDHEQHQQADPGVKELTPMLSG
jgi:hypothetical protein